MVVIGLPVRKKALLASLRRRIAREGSFSITEERSATEMSSMEASLMSFIAIGDIAGREYPEVILSRISACCFSILQINRNSSLCQ
jgi:hypothetical protein